MKRKLAILLVLAIMITLVTGCGSKKGSEAPTGSPSAESPAAQPGPVDSGSKPAAPKDVVPGTELSTFIGDYTETKSVLWDALTEKIEEEEDNMSFIFGSLAFVLSDLAIIEIVMFDMLSVKDGGIFKGTLMFSGIEAWKKVNGDIIEFGYDYVYPEETHSAEKGDRHVAIGKHDTKAQAVVYERFNERAGKVISRSVIEITRNSDNSYSSQILSVSDGESLSGIFTWFEGENFLSVIAEKENTGYDFKYNSIFGKKNLKPEDMAAGMKMGLRASLINGEAMFEEVE